MFLTGGLVGWAVDLLVFLTGGFLEEGASSNGAGVKDGLVVGLPVGREGCLLLDV